MHPLRLTQQVWQQIKELTVWRSTFYVADFLRQPPMSSIKELKKVYLVICNLCESFMGFAHWEWPLVGGNACLTPYLKLGGCACGSLNPEPSAPRVQRPQYDHVLSKEDGGMGYVDNCQLLCTDCNQKKRGLYVDYRPQDLKDAAEKIARERQAEREREEEKRRRQQDFGFEF